MVKLIRSENLARGASRYLIVFLLFWLSGCAGLLPTQRGVLHTVGPGEDLWKISKTYEVSPKVIAEVNGIYNPEDITTGDTLFIPGATKLLVVPPPTPEELAEKIEKGLFIWPVEGMIFSLYGPRWGRLHEGIDISAPLGTPIVASKDGIVVVTGRKEGYGGYGNTVEIKHDDDFSTRYAHLSKVIVKEGDTVKAGEVIGYVGCTGRCTGPHCHFEIRYRGVPLNPLFFLP
jgi:hypothetical protein